MERYLQRFGENVRQARHDHGWTQEDLSAQTGLAVVQVSRIELGKREIRLSTLIRLLDGLDVPPDTLLKGVLRKDATS
jgi:transcriptional regulator with XRE-family HTH domain